MSYSTIATCAKDSAFTERVSACVAQEQIGSGGPVSPLNVAAQMVWAVAGSADVEAAYASALAAGNPNPGGDESVVTDGMILSAVQAHWPDAEPADDPETTAARSRRG